MVNTDKQQPFNDWLNFANFVKQNGCQYRIAHDGEEFFQLRLFIVTPIFNFYSFYLYFLT